MRIRTEHIHSIQQSSAIVLDKKTFATNLYWDYHSLAFQQHMSSFDFFFITEKLFFARFVDREILRPQTISNGKLSFVNRKKKGSLCATHTMQQINKFFKRRRKFSGKENEFSPVERSLLLHFCCFLPHLAFLVSQIGVMLIGTLIFISRETNSNSSPMSIISNPFSIEYFSISTSNPFLLLWVSVAATIFTCCTIYELFTTAMRNRIFCCMSFDGLVQKVVFYSCFFCCGQTIRNRFYNDADSSAHSEIQQPEIENAITKYIRLFVGPAYTRWKNEYDSLRKPIFHPLTFKISLLIQFFAFLFIFIEMAIIFLSFVLNKEKESIILLSIACFQSFILVFIPMARFVAFTNNGEESDQQIVVRSESKYVIAMNCLVRFFIQIVALLFYFVLLCILGLAAIENAGYRLHYYSILRGSSMVREGKHIAVPNSNVQLFLHCQGPTIKNSTYSNVTIILESEINSDPPTVWQHVIPMLKDQVRVCWYYRAGYGFSTSGVLPRTVLQLAKELYFLLQGSFPTRTQFLFVSLGSGGRIIRQLLSSFQSIKALGAVFVDETCYPEDMFPYLLQNSITQVQEYRSLGVAITNIMTLFEVFGLTKYVFPVTPHYTSFNTSECQYSPCYSIAFASSLYNNRYLLTIKYEYFSLLVSTSLCQASTIQSYLTTLPVVVVTSQYNINGTCEQVLGTPTLLPSYTNDTSVCDAWQTHVQFTGEIHRQYQKRIVENSNTIKWIMAEKSRHQVPLDQPERIVEAIRVFLPGV